MRNLIFFSLIQRNHDINVESEIKDRRDAARKCWGSSTSTQTQTDSLVWTCGQAEHQDQRRNYLNTLAAPQTAGGPKRHLLIQLNPPPPLTAQASLGEFIKTAFKKPLTGHLQMISSSGNL